MRNISAKMSLADHLKRIGWSYGKQSTFLNKHLGKRPIYNASGAFVGFYDWYECLALLRAKGHLPS